MKKTIFLALMMILLGPVKKALADTSVTKGSITWTFNNDYQVGQFITGDWYVVAPNGMQVIAINPEWNGQDNGAVIDPAPGVQGWTSRGNAPFTAPYSAAINVADDLPITLAPGNSLVSTTYHELTTQEQTFINEAAVLTVLAVNPPAGSFRPGFSDLDKTLYNENQLDYTKLGHLTRTPNSPSPETIKDRYIRPWVDIVPGWQNHYTMPFHNMGTYGNDIVLDVSLASLVLQTDFTNAEKRDLLIGLTQVGIDYYGTYKHGNTAQWQADGGHSAGRKWPIIFAGIVLGEAGMQGIGAKSGDYNLTGSYGVPPADYVNFGEDDQTFYVTQSDVDLTNSNAWNCPSGNGIHCEPYSSAMMGMPEWGIRAVFLPDQNNSSFDAKYRRGLNGSSWAGEILSAHIMGAKSLWNKAALFDYLDRYEAISKGETDPFGYLVANQGGGAFRVFEQEMWDKYRDNFDDPGMIIRADVDQNGLINSTDALLTLRYSEGLEMSSTRWKTSTTTGDTNCDEATDSTDAELLLRFSLDLEMNGTTWCEI